MRQSIRTRGAFVTPWQKLRAAAILYRNTDRADGFARYPHRRNAVRLRRNTGHRLNPPQKQLSVASVFCVGCCVLRPAGGIDRRRPYPVIAVSATFNHIPFKKESLTMSTANPNKLKIKDIITVVLLALIKCGHFLRQLPSCTQRPLPSF